MTSASSPYQPQYDRGHCGVGFVADRHGRASREILNLGIDALINLEHRGALNADAKTGDGAGLLVPIPTRFFAREAEHLAGHAIDPDALAVGVFFFNPHHVSGGMKIAEAALHHHGLQVVAWRDVPVDPDGLGDQARLTMPRLLHAIINPQVSIQHSALSTQHFELQLYFARKEFEREAHAAHLEVYVPSLSSRTIVYKGLLLAPQIREFYHDLNADDFEVPLVVFHQRYSTNTFPTWARAQPFRVLCHNGEINTLQGNLAWMKTREPLLDFGSCANQRFARDGRSLIRPVIDTTGSDSAMLDNAVELLLRGGRDVRHAVAMLVPQAWEKTPELPQHIRDFYTYHACLTEPWDGPAALVFTDGQTVGAALDRNGLRPCRYFVTEDGLIGAASEAGAIPLGDRRVVVRGKLGPGQMILVETQHSVFLEDGQIKSELAARQPYGAWVKHNVRHLTALPATNYQRPATNDQVAFNYTSEELTMILRPMVETKAEAIGSMGDDTPLAMFSNKPRSLFGFFRQRFAEVTNPPIDPLREELVMSLKVRVGARGNFLIETAEQACLLELDRPFLTDGELAALKADPELSTVTLSTLVPIVGAGLAPAQGEGEPHLYIDLGKAIEVLCARAAREVRAGAQVLVLSDRGVDADHTFIPAVLALGAVHNHLLCQDLRVQCDLVIESGEPRETHHFAVLIGYGAAAVNPYLALSTSAHLGRDIQPDEAIKNYFHAIEHGLLKIMSKMGISTVDAYCGAQIFEIVGLQSEIVDRFFGGTASHLDGIGLKEIAENVLAWHQLAYPNEAALDSPGFYKFKREGELHAYNPAAVKALQDAVKHAGQDDWREGYSLYQQYSNLQHTRNPIDVRDFLTFDYEGHTVPVEEVESLHTILWRFSTAAMSHGALSAEAHSTLSVAMNRLNALSNSGEGGEDPARFHTEANDRIKQVASGRFGVTPTYLINADELQIKMAQGSKPGEGGQLPGHKVTAEIAAIRHSTPGVTLISPPPHHDIYSIEDLAQLIYDLRQINPQATISVKLVAQAGVGTVAAGVAKAGADVILISGASGGTGASPLSSIKYAGIPWELGLAEAQYVLVTNGLRGRVRLRADGGLRTGRDVVLAALLGADEYSFGTAPLIAEGCVMARACHMNTCPTGIATQRADLRAKFTGTPEKVMAFMLYVAQETREVLASLGLCSIDEAIGRIDLLKQIDRDVTRDLQLDLSQLLIPTPSGMPRRYLGEANPVSSKSPLGEQLLNDAWPALSLGHSIQLNYQISNRDRTFGARLSHVIAERFGDDGADPDTFDVTAHGSAGQSFGAFNVRGLNLTLIGEANDYVGKGMAGGRIVISNAHATTHNVLAGNTLLYGATAGELYIAGRVGERFAVRNSGAIAIVEGVGDHGCEYMTGGLAIILGSIGYNFAAGMTGGLAYLYDEDGTAGRRVNRQLVNVEPLTTFEIDYVQQWIQHHFALTSSSHAEAILNDWANKSARFLKVVPKEAAAQTQPIAIPRSTVRAQAVNATVKKS
ncbi:glutamate synthase (ferredoxin) [Thermoflexales bacterium]|nr:glutamate synthase (ferredoxin) [Thermoflexales bacterium]